MVVAIPLTELEPVTCEQCALPIPRDVAERIIEMLLRETMYTRDEGTLCQTCATFRTDEDDRRGRRHR